jgi:hypothetical protein
MISGFTTDYTPPDSSQIVFLKTDSAGFTGCHEQTVAVTADTLAITQTPITSLVEYSAWPALSITITEAIVTPTNNDACLFLSVNNTVNKNLKVYPNPFTSHLQLEVRNGAIPNQYRLIDISGRIIFDWAKLPFNQTELSFPHLESGMYLLQIQTDSASETFRIVKQ